MPSCKLWQIQAPIGNKAEWQSNLWQRDRMNSWMLQLPEHKSVSQVYLLCCPSHVVSNLGVSRKSGNKTVAADYQEQPKVQVHVWGFTLLLKASHIAGSTAGLYSCIRTQKKLLLPELTMQTPLPNTAIVYVLCWFN